MLNKVDKIKKTEIVKNIVEMIGSAVGVIFSGYKGLKANEINLLRSRMKKYNTEVKVMKNSLLMRAMEQLGITQNFISGPTMVMFIHTDDIINFLKFLFNFSKENKCLELRGGYIYNRVLSHDELTSLLDFQSKEFTIAKIVGILKGSLQKLHFLLNYNLIKLLSILNEIKRLKST